MAAMGKIVRVDSVDLPLSARPLEASSSLGHPQHKISALTEFKGVFRGRELTRKDRRIASGLLPVDDLIGGGIVRGRISEIIAEAGAGKTSLAAAFAASITRREAAAWINAYDDFDPASLAEAGVDLTRLLWVSCRNPVQRHHRRIYQPAEAANDGRFSVVATMLKAAQWILAAGGFGLVIVDFGSIACQVSQSAALRLARDAEQSGAAMLVLASRRTCGTFAALSLALRRQNACFSRARPGAPALFDGLRVEARVARNKLGGSGQIATWRAVSDCSADYCPSPAPRPFTAISQWRSAVNERW